MQSKSSPLSGRLPKQIQRALPIYIACIFILIFLVHSPTLSTPFKSARISKRSKQSALLSPTQTSHIPKKIWQTWKVNPLGFEERDSLVARTWVEKNPSWRYEVLTDDNDLYYVEMHFGARGLNRLDIVETYRELTAKIIKADLLRYLIMYVEGGLYTDIDVEALKPIDRFIPDRYNEAEVDMVVGVEIDQPNFEDHPILGKKSKSFCQWTFMSKPRQPVMLKLVDNILTWLNDLSDKQNVPISELVLDFDEVISGTGPSAFTNAILEEMTKKNGGKGVTWDEFHKLSESKLVAGILVLTVEAFAAGQGHSDSGNHNARTALVKHHYHASMWPSAHPRYSHPVFGEVERCNWETACVKTWDARTAAFAQLSIEEQKKQIAMKEKADVQEAAMREFRLY